MIARKDKQYLVFEFEDGKDVKFDLSSGQFIGKKGNPVKGLSSQLSGYSIEDVIESFQDEKYRKFLSHVLKITRTNDYWNGYSYSNLGTFLNKVRDYLNLEQFFACGFTNVDLTSKRLKLSDVPKRLQKICRQKDFTLTENLLYTYNQNPDVYANLLINEYERFNVYNLLNERDYNSKIGLFNTLIKTYNYKPQALSTYIDNIMMFEGENSQTNVIQLLHDYTTMMNVISPKFDKYPRYLATTHNIAARNYNRLKKEFSEEIFSKRINLDMEYTYKGTSFTYPKTTQDIKDEAVQQNNCVASYIDKVIDGRCDIIFMRNKDSLGVSLVTLEVVGGKVVQAKGRFNRECTTEEKAIIDKYEEYLYKNLNNKKERVA